MAKRGSFYVAEHSVWPTVCKIGVTNDPARRERQLDSGPFSSFEILKPIEMPHPKKWEAAFTLLLKRDQLPGTKDWVNVEAENLLPQ